MDNQAKDQMKSQTLSQCSRALAFRERNPWPEALPTYSWGDLLLCGFDRKEALVFDLKSQNEDFLQSFFALHPKLSLIQISEIYSSWSIIPAFDQLKINWDSFCSLYQIRFSESLQKTFIRIAATPQEFRLWCETKELGARDLAPLKAIKDIQPLNEILRFLAGTNLSKSQAVQALEWSLDLVGLETPLDQILSRSEASIDWLNDLKKLRFPQSLAQDQNKSELVRKLPWPKHCQAQWLRQGDENQLEIRIQIKSLNEFNKQVEGLSNIAKPLSEIETELWKQ